MIDPLLMMSAITYWWNLGDDNRVMAREEQQWERIRGKEYIYFILFNNSS